MARSPSRRIASVLLFLLAALALLLFDAWAFLRSSWGARILASQVEGRISDAIDGTIRIGRLGTFGAVGFRLEHVIVLDPLDEPTIAVEDLRVQLDPWRLLAGELNADIRIRGGRVAIVEIERLDDVNIGLAFQPEEPQPEGPKERRVGPPPPLPPDPPVPIVLRSLRIDDTAFLLAERHGAPPQVLVRDITIRADGHWNDRRAVTDLVLAARTLAPVAAPLAVEVRAAFAESWLDALGVEVALGETRVSARGRGEMRALEGRVLLDGTVGARQAQALGIPLARDVDFDADVWLGRSRSSVGLRASTEPGGVLAVDGWYLPGRGSFFAQLVLASLDPSAWLLDGPAGRMSGSARAVGTLLPAPRFDVGLHLQRGELLGEAVGPVAIAGTLEGDALRLDPSTLELPGGALRLQGRAAPDALAIDGALDARDLAAAARFAARLLHRAPLPVAGRGRADFRLRGTVDRPRLAASVDVPRFTWGGVTARGIDLEGSFRLGPDDLPAGRLQGTVARLQTARSEARAISIDASRDAYGAFSLDAAASTRTPAQRRAARIRLGAGGEIGPDRARIERFRLDFPQGSLVSEGSSTLDFGAGDFHVEGLVLRQRGGGSLHASGGLEGQRLAASVQGRGLLLERLPQSLLPADLSGRLSIDAEVGGTLRAPEGRVHFQLDRAAVDRLRDLAAKGDVHLGGGRIDADVEAALGGVGLVVGSYAGPLDVMGAAPGAPVDLDLAVGPIDLAGLGRALGAQLPEARLLGRITGGGAIGAPDLELQWLVSDFRIPEAPELPLLASRGRGSLHGGMAKVEMEAFAADTRILEIEAYAPLDLRRFRRDPGAAVDRMLRSSRSRAVGMIRGLDLEVIGALLDEPRLAGAIVAAFDVQGPIVDPRGTFRLEARGGPVGPIRRLDLVTLVELLPDRSRLVAGIEVDEQPPAEIRALVQAPPRAFIDGTAPPSTPAELFIDVPGIELGRLGGLASRPQIRALVTGAAGESPLLSGTLAARGAFRGTLADLPGELRIVAEDLSVRGVPLGGAELLVEQGASVSAWLAAIDPRAGTLSVRASLDGAVSPLGLARRGEALFRAMRARVEAQGSGLDLAPLALVSSINRAFGRADLEARAEGPLFALEPVGRLQVRDGAIELVGGPRYQEIAVDAEMSGERLVTARLEARAPGRGRLAAAGRLQRTAGPNPFRFEVEADEFPIGGPGGVSARVSGEGLLEGTADLDAGVRGSLQVPQARIRLPRTPPRGLQSVSRIDDVVIVTGPEAYLRARRTARAEAERALPLELRIDAPRRIFVSGEDVEAELGAELRVWRPPSGELLAAGTVRAIRGRARVLGRSFELENATALWGGGPLANPSLSLTARYGAADVTAWVDVTGTAERPEISLRSDPPLPESQIALLIASGRTDVATGRITDQTAAAEVSAQGAAVSVAGSFAAQQLRQAIGPRLPLDVLTLETAGEGTRIEAGTYVSERLYLGYLRNFLPDQDENANEVRAEYELSRTLSLETRFGDRGAAGVDLVWEKRIATPAQQRARRAAREAAAGEREVEPGADRPAAFEPEGER